MSNRKFVAVLIAILVLMTVILAPVGLLAGAVAGSSHVGVSSAKGTVWAGRLNGVTIAGNPVGDLKVGLSPLSLMTGQVRLGLRRTPVGDARVVLLKGERATGVEGLNLRTPIDFTAAGLPFRGIVAFTDVIGVFRQERCLRAQGRIQLTLAGDGPLRGVVLSGEPVCRSGVWSTTLAGPVADGEVTLVARIDGKGHYQLEMMAATVNEVMIQSFLAGGFVRDAVGARRTVAGRL